MANRSTQGKDGVVLSATRSLRYFVGLMVACALAMGLAYGVVRYAMRDVTLDTGPDPVVLREAEALRGCSNELLALTGDYLDALYEHSGQSTAEFRGWLAQDFGPRFNDTRTRMYADTIHRAQLSELMAAVDQVAVMVARPDERRPRERAVQAVRDATAAAEARIHELGADRLLIQPARLPRFRKVP